MSHQEAWCSHQTCRGWAIPNADRCLAHASSTAFDSYIKSVRLGSPLIARGVRFSAELFDRVKEGISEVDDGVAKVAARIDFRQAQFDSTVDASDVHFKKSVNLRRAQFHGKASFNRSVFYGEANFIEVTFVSSCSFLRTRFRRRALIQSSFLEEFSFEGAVFERGANFEGMRGTIGTFRDATFEGRATFSKAEMESVNFTFSTFSRCTFREANFSRAIFHSALFRDESTMSHARFTELSLRSSRFERDLDLHGVVVEGQCNLTGARFDEAVDLGPVVAEFVLLNNATFAQRVSLNFYALRVSARSLRLHGGGSIRARFAELYLDEAVFGQPTVVSGLSSDRFGLRDGAKEKIDALRDAEPAWKRTASGRPRLIGLRFADVFGLTLSGIDLRACRFGGTHNLSMLRIEPDCEFSRPPGRLRVKREVLAEERTWRSSQHNDSRNRHAATRRKDGWPTPSSSPLGVDHFSYDPPDAAALANLYRELRKAREDAKDEPGAAGFYYGEMEMRRNSKTTPRVERFLLGVYWLVSGYGLRAWRSASALLSLLLLATFLLYNVGLDYNLDVDSSRQDSASSVLSNESIEPGAIEKVWDAARISISSATSLAGVPQDDRLTRDGEAVQLIIRILGPLLLALTLLALRNRLKR